MRVVNIPCIIILLLVVILLLIVLLLLLLIESKIIIILGRIIVLLLVVILIVFNLELLLLLILLLLVFDYIVEWIMLTHHLVEFQAALLWWSFLFLDLNLLLLYLRLLLLYLVTVGIRFYFLGLLSDLILVHDHHILILLSLELISELIQLAPQVSFLICLLLLLASKLLMLRLLVPKIPKEITISICIEGALILLRVIKHAEINIKKAWLDLRLLLRCRTGLKVLGSIRSRLFINLWWRNILNSYPFDLFHVRG